MPRLDEPSARELLASVRVLRLATVAADGLLHLVPTAFAVAGDRIWTVIDPQTKVNPQSFTTPTHRERAKGVGTRRPL